jgi:hypothetical protein
MTKADGCMSLDLPIYLTNIKAETALPFVIPSAAEGSAVSAISTSKPPLGPNRIVIPTGA